MTPSSLREAASLAIWGEAPTPIVEHANQDSTSASDQPIDHHDRPPDPWQENALTPGLAP